MIILINPNSTVSMTSGMLATARATAPDVTFEGWTSHDGPPAIQGEADGVLATEPLLKLVREASGIGAEGIIIGCFDDTALSAARDIAQCPVIGIGQAGYHMAAMTGGRFSVVTTLPISIPILEANIRDYGLQGSLGRVRASSVPVLDLETDPDRASDRVIEEICAAEREDDIQSVVLGCGGMVDIAARATGRTSLRLIDGVRSAALVARTF